jgi:hypothetical protein
MREEDSFPALRDEPRPPRVLLKLFPRAYHRS